MFLKNKYTKWYFSIIEKAKSSDRKKLKSNNKNYVYYEQHHIIPKSLGGPNSLDNLVLLTAREHFICHFLLTKMLNPGAERRKMLFACHMLLAGKNRYKVNSRTYETLKKLRLQAYNENKEDNGLEERIAEALNKINEELCPAGKAYIKRRQAAGEKSSAYLSGRGVKVCKGQMSGKAKKKK